MVIAGNTCVEICWRWTHWERESGVWVAKVGTGRPWSSHVMLIALSKSWSARRTSHQPVFMDSCLAITHTCLPCLPSGRINPTCVQFHLMIALMRK